MLPVPIIPHLVAAIFEYLINFVFNSTFTSCIFVLNAYTQNDQFVSLAHASCSFRFRRGIIYINYYSRATCFTDNIHNAVGRLSNHVDLIDLLYTIFRILRLSKNIFFPLHKLK